LIFSVNNRKKNRFDENRQFLLGAKRVCLNCGIFTEQISLPCHSSICWRISWHDFESSSQHQESHRSLLQNMRCIDSGSWKHSSGFNTGA